MNIVYPPEKDGTMKMATTRSQQEKAADWPPFLKETVIKPKRPSV
jgi:hypothetical protein